MKTSEGDHMDEEIIEQVEERPPRDIHHLIGLETYQGMTDAEIEIIINFRANLLAMGIAAESKAAELAIQNEEIFESMKLQREQANANFERACGKIQFKTIEETGE